MTSPGHDGTAEPTPITLSTMGSFFFAGRILKNELGDTCHGDHGYAQYFVPQAARQFPLILWHGIGQSGKTWESTPDGRDGFWQILTRRDWPLYIIDQPRRGRAGRVAIEHTESVTPEAHPPLDSEATAWNTFRLGIWQPPGTPEFYPGVQFPTDPESIRQFMRQQTPNTGPEPFPDAAHREFLGSSVAALVDVVGPSVLVMHSHSGQYGWVAAMKRPELVKALIAIEVGEFAFPDDEPPPDVLTEDELLASFLAPQLVPADDFAALTRVPILVMMADNIATEPSTDYGIELWRLVRQQAQQFVAAVNRRGGDATYLELPDAGLEGNTHFPMADLNNVQVADILTDFLARKGLDRRDTPHRGPRL
jgi:pimeloyl-ACP methyl ester carboxylesterase